MATLPASAPRAVVFDVYGTLAGIRDHHSPFKLLLRYAQKMGREPQPDDAATIMTCPGGLIEAANRLGVQLPATVLQRLEAGLLAELSSVTLFDDVNATLAGLKDRGLKVGLCSNLAEPYAAPILRLLSIQLDCYAWSFSVGAIKPSLAIYEYVLRQVDCSPEQVLFIGDTPNADFYGPKRAGMQSRLLDRRNGQLLADVLEASSFC
jgi:FMN phosphatase YigB (HAD superfamily)